MASDTRPSEPLCTVEIAAGVMCGKYEGADCDDQAHAHRERYRAHIGRWDGRGWCIHSHQFAAAAAPISDLS